MRKLQRGFWLTVVASLALLGGCSVLGRQQPVLFEGKFSLSGRYYAYIYQETFIHSYSRRGGSSTSYGSFTHKLQVIDTQTGARLLDKPIAPKTFDCIYPQIGDVNDHYAVIACSAASSKAMAPAIFSIADKRITLDSADVAKRSDVASAGVDATDFQRSLSDPEAFIFEGQDGRLYRLDPNTGQAQPTQEAVERVDARMDEVLSGRLPRGLREEGSTRKVFVRESDGVRSQDDFLDPKLLYFAENGEREAFPPATLINGGFLVLAPQSKDDKQHLSLTLVDASTLKTRWSTPLPQELPDWASRFETKQFLRQSETLLIANSSQLLRVDVGNGQILSNVSLIDK
jgi:hypothetical protein